MRDMAGQWELIVLAIPIFSVNPNVISVQMSLAAFLGRLGK